MRQCANTLCNMYDQRELDGTNCTRHCRQFVDLCEIYITTDILREKVLKMVDICFLTYAPEHRQEAFEMAIRILGGKS